MATLDVVTIENKKAGSVDLSATVFEALVKPDLFHAEVRRQLAARRRGTHSTKNRAAVSGGGSKPWRQKGTGRARHGTNRSVQWAGGGAAFGPVPRVYQYKLSKKARRAALRGALSHRLEEGAITVVDSLDLGEFKTKRLVEILDGLGIGGSGVLIVIDGEDPHLELSARNLPRVKALRAAGATVQHLHTVGHGCPDILVGIRGCENYLLEIKDGAKPPSKRRLTKDEARWHRRWRGQVDVVKDVDEALRERKSRAKPEEPFIPPPELVAEIEEQMLRQWIDDSIPALGGLTPREAVKTPEGRQQVLELIEYSVQIQKRMPKTPGMFAPDYRKVKKMLGLE